jgi:DNA-binding GntR family transcriptional regulator
MALGHPLLREVVTDRIAEAIVRGDYQPGQRLNEVALAESLGVSRSPVREAVRQLENEGLVVSEPRKGVTVAGIGADETEQFYDCRILLQVACVRVAAPQLSQADLDAVAAVVAEMQAAAGSERLHEYLQLVRRYFEAIEAACPNRVLVDLLRGMARRAMRFRAVSIRTPGRMAQSLEHHQKLLEALRDRDGARAEALVQQMLEDSRDAILASLRD